MVRPLVIAHRGNSSEAPENTLSAFRSALALGVDGVELDYHHSADGVPVVFHDATLDRCTNVRQLWRREQVPIADCSLKELQQLDYGSWFGSKRTFAGEPLATLEEAVKLICGSGAKAIIERKAGDATTLLTLLERLRVRDQVVVMAFDWAFLKECCALAPSLPYVALGEGEIDGWVLETIAAIPAGYVGWNQRDLDQAAIERIHRHGLQAWSWTVDTVERMRELAAWGIDAVTTNVPALGLTTL